MARLTDIDALLEKVTKLVADGGTSAETVGKIIIAITEAPVADAVEVVHGRWIRRIVDISAPYHTKDECSVCHWEGEVYYRYCPGCGAKMDGERKDNE